MSSSLLGCTQLVTPMNQNEPLPSSITKAMIRNAIKDRPPEAGFLIEAIQYVGMKRIYDKIQCFIEGDSYLNGTMGIPAEVPDYLRYIEEKLLHKIIDNGRFYTVVPYSDLHLRTEALVDYLDVCRDWE
jgi:hypothetical protein